MKQHRSLKGASRARHSESGKSLIEMVTVVAIIIIVSAIAIPQLISSRRLNRSVGIAREIVAQVRYARQQAMSQRQVVSFRYDNATKQISIIDHQETGVTWDTATNAMVKLPGNGAASANVNADVTLRTVLLATSGIPAADLAYGRPPGAAATALGDGSDLTALASNQVNITFQPDGSVVDASGNPANRAIFIYNTQSPQATGCAISVLGAAGRVKLWRYNPSADSYAE